jgi:hypothetical protein
MEGNEPEEGELKHEPPRVACAESRIMTTVEWKKEWTGTKDSNALRRVVTKIPRTRPRPHRRSDLEGKVVYAVARMYGLTEVARHPSVAGGARTRIEMAGVGVAGKVVVVVVVRKAAAVAAVRAVRAVRAVVVVDSQEEMEGGIRDQWVNAIGWLARAQKYDQCGRVGLFPDHRPIRNEDPADTKNDHLVTSHVVCVP